MNLYHLPTPEAMTSEIPVLSFVITGSCQQVI